MTITLYELQPTRSARVRWTLPELGIPFESIEGRGREMFAMPELAQIHPMSKLPASIKPEAASARRAPAPPPRGAGRA